MTTSAEITVSAPAKCAFSMAEEYAIDFFRTFEAGGPAADIHLPVPAPVPLELTHRVRLMFGLHLDILEAGRMHDEMRFHWTSGSRLLPDFKGTVRFRIAGDGTKVLIAGTYAPPLGLLGAAFDSVIGRTIARASLQDLANRIAANLTEREAIWRSGLAPVV